MRKIFVTSIILVISMQMSAQVLDNNGMDVLAGSMFSEKRSSSGKNIEGSPYIIKDFLNAKIKDMSNVYKLRYNAFSDEVEAQKDGSVIILSRIPQYNEIKFIDTGDVLKLLSYQTKDGVKEGYLYELFFKNGYGLYRKEQVTFIDEKPPLNSYQETTPATYDRSKPVLYMLTPSSNTAVKVPTNKKGLIELMPEKSEQIEAYLKKNKVDFKNERNLIYLFQSIS